MQRQNQTCWHVLHNQWRSALSGVAALSCWTPYWTFTVSRIVSSKVSRDVSGNRHRVGGPAGLSASARQPGRGPKAIALLQANVAGCLRALANLSASFSCNSPGLSQRPVTGAHGRPAGYGKKNQVRASSEWPPRSRPTPFPMMPAAPSAPDHRPIRSHALSHHQAGGQARFARDEAPHQSRLGTLPPLSLLGTRECFCRNQLTQRWGASFALLRLGASHCGSPVAGATCARVWLGPRRRLPRDKHGLCSLSHFPFTGLRCQQWLAAAGARREQQTHFLVRSGPPIHKGEVNATFINPQSSIQTPHHQDSFGLEHSGTVEALLRIRPRRYQQRRSRSSDLRL